MVKSLLAYIIYSIRSPLHWCQFNQVTLLSLHWYQSNHESIQ